MTTQIQHELKGRIYNYFTELQFQRIGHKYTINGRQLTSVTNLVKSFIPVVDWNSVAYMIAPHKGTTGKKLIKDWKYERDISVIRGNNTHNFGELLGKGCRKPETNQEKALIKFWTTVDKHRYIRVAREVRMYHKALFFCGTCDFVLYDTWTRTFIIGDYKTNKDIFKQYGSKRLLYPFDFLLDRPFEHYEIQLSLYSILLGQLGIPISERWIVWLMDDEKCKQKRLPLASYKLYKTPDHSSICLGWLHQKNNFYYNEQ